MFECVINISEGRNHELLARLDQAAGGSLRDRHSDPFHHRSVFTLINEADELVADVHQLIRSALGELDIRRHQGVHPRLGVVDVVPFVALAPHRLNESVALRDQTADWLAATFDLPVFLYGPLGAGDRSLPEVRRRAFRTLAPDRGPARPDERSGAVTVGARPLLVAWNLWLEGVDLARTKELAASLRRPGVRTLGLAVGDSTQVSCNVIDVATISLADLYDELTILLGEATTIARAELVGLAPWVTLQLAPETRWAQLGLRRDATIEWRLGQLA